MRRRWPTVFVWDFGPGSGERHRVARFADVTPDGYPSDPRVMVTRCERLFVWQGEGFRPGNGDPWGGDEIEMARGSVSALAGRHGTSMITVPCRSSGSGHLVVPQLSSPPAACSLGCVEASHRTAACADSYEQPE
jgi:hypothetical protein